jgi:hypothetical protein
MLKGWSNTQKLLGLVVVGGAGFLLYRLVKDTSSTTTAGFLNPNSPDWRHVAGAGPLQQITGSQLPLRGQQPRGPMQHIAAPYNAHSPEMKHWSGADPRGPYQRQWAGSPLPLPGQQPRGPMQHIAAPFNSHDPHARHLAGQYP